MGIGHYWAQPQEHRLTFPHSVAEVSGQGRGPCRKIRDTPDKIMALIDYLSTGPKTKKQIKKGIGVTDYQLEMMILLATNYEPKLWEDYRREGKQDICYLGLR